MRGVRFGIAAGIALAIAPAAQAQEAPTSYLMLTYYRCAQGDVARADAIFKDQVVPLLKAAQSAGNITTYGWGKHVDRPCNAPYWDAQRLKNRAVETRRVERSAK